MREGDWPSVRAIYAEGIATGHATFEAEPPTWQRWDASHLAEPRLVAVDADVTGWAALARVSSRCVYAGVAEVSVYVSAAARGRGVGAALLGALVEASEAAGVWTLEAGIFTENAASVALHRRAGFRVVGVRQRLGKMHGRWRDVMLLERRSQLI